MDYAPVFKTAAKVGTAADPGAPYDLDAVVYLADTLNGEILSQCLVEDDIHQLTWSFDGRTLYAVGREVVVFEAAVARPST